MSRTRDRAAVVDIGTNTLLLLIVEPNADGDVVRVQDECRFGRLGQGVDESGELHPDAIERSLAIVREFRSVMDACGVGRIAAVGTQALREARNASEFRVPAEATLGAPIEIIAGEREAELVSIAVARSFPELGVGPMAIADVGGGSTEVIVCQDGQVQSFRSLPIGSVRFAERFLSADPPTADQASSMFSAIDEALESLSLPAGAPLVGTAGTATTIASVELGLRTYEPERIQGARVPTTVIDRQLARYLELPLQQRRKLVGLEPERADVIAAGVAIYTRLLHRMATPELIVSDRGVRWGLAYSLFQ